MGIRGLYSFFALNLRAYAMLDLVQKANIVKNMEILIDFRSFSRDLDEFIIRKLIANFDNEYLSISCVEYDVFGQAYLEFHNMFAENGIKLVWVFDGIKGLDEVIRNNKGETWTYRCNNYSNFIDAILECSQNKTPFQEMEKNIPLYNYLAVMEKLKNSGAEVIKLLQGGSDEFIASEFHRRQSFAIFSNDTDFLVFKDCRVIFPRILLDRVPNKFPFMDMENPRRFFTTSTKLVWPIVTQNDIFRCLQFSTHEEIIILSILKGNDNTRNYSQNLLNALGISKSPDRLPHISQVAKYIKSNSVNRNNLFELNGMIYFLVENPEFENTVNFCFDFYTLNHYRSTSGKTLIHFDQGSSDGSLTSFFQRKLSNIEISDQLYGSHFGKNSSLFSIEIPIETFATTTAILSEIRSKIYPYVLNTDLDCVMEYRNRDSWEATMINVVHSPLKSNLIISKPDSESERQNGVIYGIDIFEEIWSRLENQNSLNFVRQFGLEKGFLCYILRYFYKVTTDLNIDITAKEFEAIFSMVFYRYKLSTNMPFQTRLNQDLFFGMKICPSEKCLKLFSCFMEIYITAKYFCGGALNLLNDFPILENVISSSVFIAFYENNLNDINERVNHLDESVILKIQDLENTILGELDSVYQAITE